MKVASLSALRTDRFYPPEIFLVLISVRGWVDPRSTVRPKELCQRNVPEIASGMEPENLPACSAVPQQTAPRDNTGERLKYIEKAVTIVLIPYI
jgi:hypothetical protein